MCPHFVRFLQKTNQLSNELIFIQVCQAALVFANAAFLLMAVMKNEMIKIENEVIFHASLFVCSTI